MFDPSLISDILKNQIDGYENIKHNQNIVGVRFSCLTASFAYLDNHAERPVNWYGKVFHTEKNYSVHEILFPHWDTYVTKKGNTEIKIREVPGRIIEFAQRTKTNDRQI